MQRWLRGREEERKSADKMEDPEGGREQAQADIVRRRCHRKAVVCHEQLEMRVWFSTAAHVPPEICVATSRSATVSSHRAGSSVFTDGDAGGASLVVLVHLIFDSEPVVFFAEAEGWRHFRQISSIPAG